MIGKPHILSTQDVQRGIQALAAFLLGDAGDWPVLVALNQLAPPYLALTPASIYGPAVSSLTLPSAVAADSTQITLPNQPQSSNTIYLATAGASGLLAEAVSVESYANGVFTLATPLRNSYPQGSQVQLFAAYTTGNTQVLLPGEVLYLPVVAPTSFTVSSTGQLTDVFGSDIALPVTFAGDVQTVQGLATLAQRMQIALQTLIRSVPLHPEFGSHLGNAVGKPTTQTKWAALVRDCLMHLPEVKDVRSVTATPQGNRLYVTAKVYPHTSGAAIELVNEPLTLVG